MSTLPIPQTWQQHPAADGYNPGPELTATYDGITVAVQRTHLHDDRATYYFEIRTEGTAIPLIDGAIITPPTMPIAEAAAFLCWNYYATATTWRPDDLNIQIWPATSRTPNADQRAALHILHQEAFT